MLEYGIEVGRGGLYLKLTLEQHAKLKRPVAFRQPRRTAEARRGSLEVSGLW
jgi:hypothetical protein